jgi:hypothetical protein
MAQMRASPAFSKRQLLAGLMSIVALLGAANVSVAQQALDFDTVMAKEGGYAGIVKEFLGTIDPKIIALVKREGDRYISSLPYDQRRKAIRDFRSSLENLLGNAKGNRPSTFAVDFFAAKAPQLLIEFIPYEREYPNIAELGRGEQAIRRGDEAQRRGDEAQRRAREEAEFGRRLKQLNGPRQ